MSQYTVRVERKWLLRRAFVFGLDHVYPRNSYALTSRAAVRRARRRARRTVLRKRGYLDFPSSL